MPWELIEPYQNYIVIGVAGLVALLVLVFLIRMLGRTAANRRSGNRLEVTDYHDVDNTRRLLMIRRDNVEHLVMIGGPQDLVIESRIIPGEPALEPARPLPMRPDRSTTVDTEYGEASGPSGPFKPAQMAPRPGSGPGPNIREPMLTGARRPLDDE